MYWGRGSLIKIIPCIEISEWWIVENKATICVPHLCFVNYASIKMQMRIVPDHWYYPILLILLNQWLLYSVRLHTWQVVHPATHLPSTRCRKSVTRAGGFFMGFTYIDVCVCVCVCATSCCHATGLYHLTLCLLGDAPTTTYTISLFSATYILYQVFWL